MTTTVESLRLEIDTRDVTRATSELDRMSASSSALAQRLAAGESSVWRFNGSLSDAQKTAQQTAQAAQGVAASVDDLRAATGSAAAAQDSLQARARALAAAQSDYTDRLAAFNKATEGSNRLTGEAARVYASLRAEGESLVRQEDALIAAMGQANARTAETASAMGRAQQATQSTGAAAESTAQRVKVSNRAFEQFNDGLTSTERAAKQAADAQRALELEARRLNAATVAMTPGQQHFMETIRQMADQAGKSSIELLRMKAAELGLTEQTKALIDQIDKAKQSTQGFSLKSSDTRQSLMSAFTNLAQGNVGEARQALGSLVSQAAEAGPRFLLMAGAIGVAVGAIGALIYLAKTGHDEMKAMNNAIEMTGHYADISVQGINRMADSLAATRLASLNESRALITALVASGQIGTDQLEKVARVAIQYAHATGEEVDKIAPKIIGMFANPTKGAEEFNRATHALNVTQLEHIKTLEAAGDKAAAQDALQEQMKNHIPDQQKHLGELAKAVSAVATAWQEVTRWMKEALNGKMMTPVDAAKEALQAARDRRSELLARGMKWSDPAVKAADAAIEAQEKVVGDLTKTNAALSEQAKANEKNARAWEAATGKSQVYAVTQLKLQKQLIQGFQPDAQQPGEDKDQYTARAAQQQAAKLDALRVIDKQIRDTNNAIGADGRAVATQRIQDELALHEIQRKALAENLTQNHALGKLEDDEFNKAMSRVNVERLTEQKAAEQRILALGGLSDAQIKQHQDRVEQLNKEINLENTRPDMKQELDDYNKWKASMVAIYGVNVQVNTALDDQIKKQKEANAELGLSAEVAARVRAAREALDLKQKQSDADYLRKRLAELPDTDENKYERAALQLRLDGLDGEIARRKEINALVKEGQAKSINLQVWTDAAKQAQAFGQALADAFGHAGAALGGLAASLGTYIGQQQQAEKDLKAMLDLEPDQGKRAELIDKAQQKSAQLQIKTYADMTGAAKGFFNENSKGYKALEAAEKAFRLFELGMALANSVKKIALTQAEVAATVTGNTQKAGSAVAEAGTEVAAEGVKGTAKAATAVANQAAGGDPYTAWARMAAMVAAMAAIGFAVKGSASGPGPNDAATVQASQGTGSVLGDPKAKSESITKALENLKDNSDLMLPLTAQMAASLRAIQSGIGQIGSLSVQSGVTDASNMNLNTNGMNLEPMGRVAGLGLGGVGGFAAGTYIGMGSLSAGLATAGGATAAGMGAQLGSLAGPVGLVVGAIAGALAGKLIGGTDKSVTDSGLLFGGTIGQIEQTGGVQQYANVHTSSHGLTRVFSGGPSDDLKTQALPDNITQQFSLVFKNLDSTLQTAAQALGQDASAVSAAISNVKIDATKISLQGKTGDEINKAITDVLSKAMDDAARAALPGLESFIHVGEGYAQTAVRVATGVEQAKVALDHFGIAAVKYTDLLDKQADVGGAITRESILAVERSKAPLETAVGNALGAMSGIPGAIGGLLNKVFGAVYTEAQGALTGVGKIIENLSGTADDIAAIYQTLLDLRRQMGDVKLNGQDLSQEMIAGAGGVKNLQTGLDNYLTKGYFTDAEQSAAAIADLKKQFEALGVAMPTTKASLRAMIEQTGTATPEAAKLTGALLNLTGAFAEVIDKADELAGKSNLQQRALDNLQKAYDKATGDLNNTINRLSNWQTQLTNFGNSIALGQDSPLTPEQKYAEAKRQYEDTVTKAKAGDETAQANFTSVAQAFLAASRTVNASDQQYTSDYAQVVSMTSELKISATSQIDVAKQQLAMLKAQVSGVLQVNDSVLSVAQAIRELSIAILQEKGQAAGPAAANTDAVTAIYQSVLGRAPDAAGLNYWTDLMRQGTTLEQVQSGIANSPEATGTAAITNLYQTILGRAPDAEGLNFWKQAYVNGESLDQIAADFKKSPEYLAAHGSHESGLERVPYDGYRAELHKDEAVVDARAVKELRTYFRDATGEIPHAAARYFDAPAHQGEAMPDDARALAAQAIGQAQESSKKPHGSHMGGLERVPHHGYRAELHKDETVVDAQASAALRRYFGAPAAPQNNGNTALVAVVRELQAEVAALRADNDRQAAALAQVIALAAQQNGERVAGAVQKGNQGAAWAAQNADRKVLK